MKRSRRKFLKTAVSNLAVPMMAGLAPPGQAKAKSPSDRTASNPAPGFFLAENGTGRATIVLPDSASEVMKFAAEELNRYVGSISSAALPIRTFQPGSSEKQVLLGSPSQVRRVLPVGEEVDWPAEGTDEFTIKVTQDRMVLCGGSERSTLYAIYQVLEDLGCRWLAPGQDHLPKRETLEFPLGSKTVKPALEWRIILPDTLPLTSEFVDYFAKQKFNVLFLHPIPMIEHLSPQHQEAIKRRGLLVMGGGHSPVYFLPIEEYGTVHPEWFSLIKGRRSKPGEFPWKICHSNDDAVRVFNQNCIEFLQAHPLVDFLAVWENDGYGGWCECDRCRALEPDPDRKDSGGWPDRSVTYFRWVKQVADAVHEQMPNKRILFGPYYNMMTFPADPKVVPPADSLLMLDDYRQCYRHSLGDPCNLPTEEAFPRDWRPHYPDTAAWVYYHTRVCGIPEGLGTRISKDMQYLAQQGVHGFLDCMSILEAPDLPMMFEHESLSFYVLAKFSWDPSLDLGEVTRDFTDHSYGPAAETMRKFYNLLDATTYGFGQGPMAPEDKAYLKQIHTGAYMSPRAYIPNRERLEELKALAAQALAESTDEAVRQRIQPLLAGMEVAECLWDGEKLPPNRRMTQMVRIRQLAGPYLRLIDDPELSFGNRSEPMKSRLGMVLDQWMKESSG